MKGTETRKTRNLANSIVSDSFEKTQSGKISTLHIYKAHKAGKKARSWVRIPLGPTFYMESKNLIKPYK